MEELPLVDGRDILCRDTIDRDVHQNEKIRGQRIRRENPDFPIVATVGFIDFEFLDEGAGVFVAGLHHQRITQIQGCPFVRKLAILGLGILQAADFYSVGHDLHVRDMFSGNQRDREIGCLCNHRVQDNALGLVAACLNMEYLASRLLVTFVMGINVHTVVHLHRQVGLADFIGRIDRKSVV